MSAGAAGAAAGAAGGGGGFNISGTNTDGKNWNVSVQGMENLKGLGGMMGGGGGQQSGDGGGGWDKITQAQSNSFTQYLDAAKSAQSPQAIAPVPAPQPKKEEKKPTGNDILGMTSYIEAANRANEQKKAEGQKVDPTTVIV